MFGDAETKTARAYRTIRAHIENGLYNPGERLRAGDLEERLRMSPTPIREALRLLEADGLVVNEPHKGTRVADAARLSDPDEIYQLRAILEPLAVEFAADRMTHTRFARLQELHAAMLESVESRREDAVLLNAAWHRELYDAADMPLLTQLIDLLWNAMHVNPLWTPGFAATLEHTAVMEALADRDSERARAAMEQHIVAGHQRSARRIKEATLLREGEAAQLREGEATQPGEAPRDAPPPGGRDNVEGLPRREAPGSETTTPVASPAGTLGIAGQRD